MQLRRSLVTLLVAAAVAACQTAHEPPDNTNPDEPTGRMPIGGNGAVASSGSTTTSSSSSGTGGAAAFEPQPADLSCADSLAHDSDCEACMYFQSGQLCIEEWIACGDDPYCETGFHTCSQACKPGDAACLTDCYNEKPAALDLVLQFSGCACTQCATLCG